MNGSEEEQKRKLCGSVSAEEIALSAYYKFLASGCNDGKTLEHWLEAEKELRLIHRSQSAICE